MKMSPGIHLRRICPSGCGDVESGYAQRCVCGVCGNLESDYAQRCVCGTEVCVWRLW